MGYKLSPSKLDHYLPLFRTHLMDAARQSRLVPYKELETVFGGPGRGYVGQVLDALNREVDEDDKPLLSAIVVSADSKRSSAGFFDLVRSLRPQVTLANEHEMWAAERDRVWAYRW